MGGNTIILDMRPTGIEPVAYRLGICRSIRLSYGRVLISVAVISPIYKWRRFGAVVPFIAFPLLFVVN